MKHVIFILLCVLPSLAIQAGNGDSYFSLKTGFLFPQTFNSQLSYHRTLNYDTSVEFLGEIGKKNVNTNQPKNYYWAGGLAYYKGIKRYKNAELCLLSEFHAGAHIRHFFFGLGIGLEYTYTYPNGIQLVIQQKNQVNFLHNDTFKNGLLLGLRIPL